MKRLLVQRSLGSHNPAGSRNWRNSIRQTAPWATLAMAVALLPCVRARAGNAPQGAQSTSNQANSSPAGNAQAGKQAFMSEGCFACHGLQAQGTNRTRPKGIRIGPPTFSFAFFSRYVRQPTGLMPTFGTDKLTDAQIADIYAFLKTVPPPPASQAEPPGNAQTGKALFERDGCYECHGYQGQGSLQTGGPEIGPPPFPFSAFLGYIRHPSGSMPPYTNKIVSEAEAADIYAYLKSIPLPPPPSSIPLLNQ